MLSKTIFLPLAKVYSPTPLQQGWMGLNHRRAALWRTVYIRLVYALVPMPWTQPPDQPRQGGRSVYVSGYTNPPRSSWQTAGSYLADI